MPITSFCDSAASPFELSSNKLINWQLRYYTMHVVLLWWFLNLRRRCIYFYCLLLSLNELFKSVFRDELFAEIYLDLLTLRMNHTDSIRWIHCNFDWICKCKLILAFSQEGCRCEIVNIATCVFLGRFIWEKRCDFL
jgi:hypothetical protein